MTELLTYFTGQKQAMVDQLTTLVNFETPTTDKASVDTLGEYMRQQFEGARRVLDHAHSADCCR
ncbi:MAG: hypothetical protein HND48_19720 [Chloroflexi bacterium]|nr:hypothetical protein [Chloroflexota bacterium]